MASIVNNMRLKASSLLETIVAMVVIVIVFGISMTIYVNILRNGISLAELKASQKLEEIAKQTKAKQSYFDEIITFEGISINKTIKKYPSEQQLWVLDMKAIDAEKRVLSEYREIITEDGTY